jgi:hypothetical protein
MEVRRGGPWTVGYHQHGAKMCEEDGSEGEEEHEQLANINMALKCVGRMAVRVRRSMNSWLSSTWR